MKVKTFKSKLLNQLNRYWEEHVLNFQSRREDQNSLWNKCQWATQQRALWCSNCTLWRKWDVRRSHLRETTVCTQCAFSHVPLLRGRDALPPVLVGCLFVCSKSGGRSQCLLAAQISAAWVTARIWRVGHGSGCKKWRRVWQKSCFCLVKAKSWQWRLIALHKAKCSLVRAYVCVCVWHHVPVHVLTSFHRCVPLSAWGKDLLPVMDCRAWNKNTYYVTASWWNISCLGLLVRDLFNCQGPVFYNSRSRRKNIYFNCSCVGTVLRLIFSLNVASFAVSFLLLLLFYGQKLSNL